MVKLHPFIINTDGTLTDYTSLIQDAVLRAEKYAFKKLAIDWDIDVVITNHEIGIIPEEGIGCTAFNQFFLLVSINVGQVNEDLIAETIVGALGNMGRWGKNPEWAKTLFDALICEGLSVYLEAEYTKDYKEKPYFLNTILKRSDVENQNILKKIIPFLWNDEYDYNAIFYEGNQQLPRWAGYSVGYFLVKQYVQKTKKALKDVYTDEYAKFAKILNIKKCEE